jgi:ubiquinone/menaquinone biosynthesis C-methylase UbiE
MLKKARKYSAQYGVKPILIRADISSLPLESAKVDFIYSAGVLIHLPKQKVEAVIGEMARLLKPGGSVVLENSFLGWLNPDGLQTKIATALLSKWLKPAWVRTYTYQEIHQLFTTGVDFSFLDVRPDAYKVLPKGFLKYSFPQLIKAFVHSFNRNVSSRLSFNNLFVSRWTVKAQK